MATKTAIIRITKEIAEFQRNTDLSINVAFRDENVKHVRALIIGPPDSPYEFGFFEFNLQFPSQYPTKSPYVRAITTNNGQTRFNPNIYADGKVCLSILGTWHGEAGETWSTAQGLESVLVSIQSLMSCNPYENEPGFEGEPADSKTALEYAAKIRHETLRLTVIERLEVIMGLKKPHYDELEELHLLRDPLKNDHYQFMAMDLSNDDHDNDEEEEEEKEQEDADATVPMKTITPQHPKKIVPNEQTGPAAKKQKITPYVPLAKPSHYHTDINFDPFADLFKRRFLWYYDVYLKMVDEASGKKEQCDGTKFVTTVFESDYNGMLGTYEYSSLKRRMVSVRKSIDAETSSWERQGLQAKKNRTASSSDFEGLIGQIRQRNKSGEFASSFDVELVDGNPFVWHLTVFGPYSTDLDGAIINIIIYFPQTFPEDQPRVNVQTALFHHRVSPTNGVLCYTPDKPDEVISHLRAILRAIVEDDPGYDPRTLVNPEAAALLWGGDDKKKIYRRKLRRSVQDSLEQG